MTSLKPACIHERNGLPTEAASPPKKFDAINGDEQRYEAIQIKAPASLHVSVRTAAIQAAYEVLRNLYPAQDATLAARRNASIAALTDSPHQIAAGVAWGHSVADACWQSRLTDGFVPQPAPAFYGADVTGVWRRTPPAMANGFGVEFASMRPWTSAFRRNSAPVRLRR